MPHDPKTASVFVDLRARYEALMEMDLDPDFLIGIQVWARHMSQLIKDTHDAGINWHEVSH